MNAQLKQMIDEAREESFVPEARDGVTDGEALGLVIARHFEWDGIAILEAAISALEDANFHTAAGAIQEILDVEKATG